MYDDLLAAFEVSNVIDLTPGDGTLTMACLRRHCMYVGFTFTQAHAEHLRKRSEKSILKAMMDEQDELYKPRLRAAVADGATIDGGEGGIPTPKEKAKLKKATPVKPKAAKNLTPKGKPRAKRTPNAKAKGHAVVDDQDPCQDDDEEGDEEEDGGNEPLSNDEAE